MDFFNSSHDGSKQRWKAEDKGKKNMYVTTFEGNGLYKEGMHEGKLKILVNRG